MLYRLALTSGVQVDFGMTVVGVTPGEPRPSITLSTGEVLTADLIVGADGPTSLVRDVVLGRVDDAEPEGMTIFAGVIPASEMLKDPEMGKWIESNEVRQVQAMIRNTLLT